MYRVKVDKIKDLTKFGFVKLSEKMLQERYQRGSIFIYCNCEKANKILNTTTEKINEVRKKNHQHLIFEGAITETDGYSIHNLKKDSNFAIQDLIAAGIVESVEI